MGATGIYTPHKTLRKCIQEHLINDYEFNLGGETKLLDHAIRGELLWILYYVPSKDYNAIAVVDCYLENGEFIFKEVEDNTGPYQTSCPERLLERATSTHPTALEWYKKCRDAAKSAE